MLIMMILLIMVMLIMMMLIMITKIPIIIISSSAMIGAITEDNKGVSFCAHHKPNPAGGSPSPPDPCAISNQSKRHPADG